MSYERAFVVDSNSSLSEAEQWSLYRRFGGPLAGFFAKVMAQFDSTTGAYAGPIVLDDITDTLAVGAFGSVASGSGIAINRTTVTKAVGVYADDAGAALYGSGSVPEIRGTLSRLLITAAQTAGNVRLSGLMGQIKAANVAWNSEEASGVNGRAELVQTSGTVTFGGYGVTAGVTGHAATAGTLTINTNHVFAGVAALADIKGTVTQTGIVAGLYAGKYDTTNWSDATSRAQWKYGIYVQAAGALIGGHIGEFTTGAATTAAIPFAATQNVYSDGQLSTWEVHGSSNANLTSAYSAKVGRYRHVVNCTTAAHETYGLMGQLVVKDTTLSHLHAGLIGTFEGHTSGVVSNGAYACSVAAVMARVGGGAAITATKVVSGFSAVWNGAALASGSSAAFSACMTSTAPWSMGVYLPGTEVKQGLVIGGGTSPDTGTIGTAIQIGLTGTQFTLTTADQSAIKAYVTTSAASGDNRLAYLKYTISSTGGGECLRALTSLTGVVGTARGAHISLSPSGSGNVTGQAAALCATLHYPDAGLNGWVGALQAQIYPEAGGTNAALPTNHGLLWMDVVSGSDDTQAAKVLNAMLLTTASTNVGNKSAALMVSNADVTGGGGASAGGIAINVNGTRVWLATYTI